jgi:hypothetical protein
MLLVKTHNSGVRLVAERLLEESMLWHNHKQAAMLLTYKSEISTSEFKKSSL